MSETMGGGRKSAAVAGTSGGSLRAAVNAVEQQRMPAHVGRPPLHLPLIGHLQLGHSSRAWGRAGM